jgi:hypothetical protein
VPPFPVPHRISSAARRFPNFRQPGAPGQSTIRWVLGLEARYALTILTVLMWRWCRRRWVLMVLYGVWLAGKFFCWSKTSRPFPIRLWAARGNHFALQPMKCCGAAPPSRELHLALGGGYLGTDPTLVMKFFNFFFAAAKALWVGLTSCNCNTCQRRTLITTGIDSLTRYAEVNSIAAASNPLIIHK